METPQLGLPLNGRWDYPPVNVNDYLVSPDANQPTIGPLKESGRQADAAPATSSRQVPDEEIVDDQNNLPKVSDQSVHPAARMESATSDDEESGQLKVASPSPQSAAIVHGGSIEPGGDVKWAAVRTEISEFIEEQRWG